MSAPVHEPEKPSSGEFFPSLDGIRGLAVLSVVVYHTAYFNPTIPLQKFLFSVTKAGFMGVPIFFVLSGFLISFTIIKTQNQFNLALYATRRAAKIIPPFIISLVIFSFLCAFWKNPEKIGLSALAYLSTVANFTEGWDEINPVYWSLMVEIHFYIVFPVIFFAFKPISKHPELWAALLLLVVPVAVRSMTHLPPSSDSGAWFRNAQVFPKALDNFVLGILFSHILWRRDHYKWLIKKSKYLCLAGVITLSLGVVVYSVSSYFEPQTNETPAPPNIVTFELFRCLPAFGTFFLLFCIFIPPHSLIRRLLALPPLQYLGLISYEWFLFHYPPVQFIASQIGTADGSLYIYSAKTIFPFFASLALSAAIYHFVSKPILEWSKIKLAKS